MIAIAAANPAPSVSLLANLFTSCGKLAVRITSLGEDRAAVRAERRPPVGSFAFLVRNGVKVPALVAWGEGDVVGLQFEEPFVGDRRETDFRSGTRRKARAAMPAERINPPMVIAAGTQIAGQPVSDGARQMQ